MRIAQLVGPWLPVNAFTQAGVEKMVSYLTEGLVNKGHDVTLFASGDSQTKAKLYSTVQKSLGSDPEVKKDPSMSLRSVYDCFDRARDFDVIHNHAGEIGLFFPGFIPSTVVHTLHESLSEGEIRKENLEALVRFKHQNYISISNAQREGKPDLNFVATIHYGIPSGAFNFDSEGGDYLCWLGRVTPKKGLTDALAVSTKLSLPIKVSTIVDTAEVEYYESQILTRVDSALVEMHERLTGINRSTFLGKAKAMLFPIASSLSFGLVMVEAMATGTPVIAYGRGAVSEIVVDNVTGFIVPPEQGINGMVEAVQKLNSMSLIQYKAMRIACRQHVEQNFTAEKMVEGYEAVYKKLVNRG